MIFRHSTSFVLTRKLSHTLKEIISHNYTTYSFAPSTTAMVMNNLAARGDSHPTAQALKILWDM